MAGILKKVAVVGLYGVGVYSGVVYYKIKNPDLFHVSDEERRSVWEEIAARYDREISLSESVLGINGLRKELIAHAKGDVLEVAAGTGRNMDYYSSSTQVVLTDSSSSMVQLLQTKLKSRPKLRDHMRPLLVNVQELSSAVPKQFDTVVDTFGLCSVDDGAEALKQMGGKLREGGRILLLEHGLGSCSFINSLLNARASSHARDWGCWYNRDIEKIVAQSGLQVIEHKTTHFGTTHFYILSNK